jgi:hypothetical protein
MTGKSLLQSRRRLGRRQQRFRKASLIGKRQLDDLRLLYDVFGRLLNSSDDEARKITVNSR